MTADYTYTEPTPITIPKLALTTRRSPNLENPVRIVILNKQEDIIGFLGLDEIEVKIIESVDGISTAEIRKTLTTTGG